MTTYICFLIAMIILYIMKLLSGGFNLISPNGTQLIALIAAYVIAIGCSLFVWYQARKNIN